MNILVLGASGMSGHVISLYLREKGHNVDTVSGSIKLEPKTTLLNATNLKSIHEYLKKNNYDVVINCIASLVEQSKAKPVLATQLNAALPLYLEDYYKESDTRIIQISTDGVFSGKRPFYIETDIRDGETFYGRSKALGELDNAKDLTLRLSITGPCMREEGSGLFHWILNQSGVIMGFTNIQWIGITTIELAKAIEQAINQNITGVYHLASSASISKMDLLSLIKDEFSLDNINIHPVKTNDTVINAVIKNTRTDFDYTIPDYRTMVTDMKTWIETHPEIYTHYAA
jgi:dTDP-4-dehydrorhamnose reductase